MKFEASVRLLAVALGVMSALRLATDGLGFPLLPFLNAVVLIYDNVLETIVALLIEPVISAVFAMLPKPTFVDGSHLLSHWKHVFVLMWLFFGSFGRAYMRTTPGTFDRFPALWGRLCAVLAGVVAGIFPPTSPAVFGLPALCFFLFTVGIYGATHGEQRARWGNTVGFTGLLWFLAMYLALDPSNPARLQFTGSSPGLAMLAIFVTGLGLIYLVTGLVFEDERLNSRPARAGLEVLSILGGAAIIVYLARLMS